ncbi:TorF family putative porin [Sphingomonas turrisvirgatae]|uniref:TorF family putative porin n=1 Tax=Sphingomonas turrisvirgatae TaxID=1888892 RepID=UPI0019D374E4|nr:TorF family putative porin [Sphingomonas turrisvirgatae]
MAIAALTLIAATPAWAQLGVETDASVELTTDLRERGLSQSGGEASGAASLTVNSGAIGGELRATALRGSARHGGADAGAAASLWYRIGSGGWQFEAGGTYRAFIDGAGELDYAEVHGTANYLIGPLDVGVGAYYAPDQRAIGGDNLYLRARARASLPGMPWTLAAHVGRSSGAVDDFAKAARLRPAGNYTDWSLGVEWARGPLYAAVRYTDTDIARGVTLSPFADRSNSGARVIGAVGLSF